MKALRKAIKLATMSAELALTSKRLRSPGRGAECCARDPRLFRNSLTARNRHWRNFRLATHPVLPLPI
jgi:hypothetical protein